MFSKVFDYTCNDCKGTSWKVLIGHRTDGETILIIQCANPKCLKKKEKELGVDADDPSTGLIVWDEFNITSQGYDDLDDDAHNTKIPKNQLN